MDMSAPPESTRLRIGDDIAWSEINGVYDRDDSLKENTNPKCLLKNHNNHPGGGGGSSQRFSGNLKPTAAPIIGLPGGTLGARRHHAHHPPATLFPGKAGGGRAPRSAVPEPGSPKVSCVGKVLPDRDRAARFGRAPRRRAPGCCGCPGLLLLRRARSRNCAVECVDDQSPPLPPPLPAAEAARRSAATREPKEAGAAAPALGGVRRFASGRRAAEWAAQVEVEEDGDGHVAARSGPLYL